MGEKTDERDCHTKWRRKRDRDGCCGDYCAVGCGGFAHNPPFDPPQEEPQGPKELLSWCRGRCVSSTGSQGRTCRPQSVLLAVPPSESTSAAAKVTCGPEQPGFEDSGVQRSSHLTISSCPQRDRGCGSLVKHLSRMGEALGSVSSTQTNKQKRAGD